MMKCFYCNFLNQRDVSPSGECESCVNKGLFYTNMGSPTPGEEQSSFGLLHHLQFHSDTNRPGI